MRKVKDLTGQRFGRLVAIERIPRKGVAYWECACDCGNHVVVFMNSLRIGRTKSCGCLRADIGVKPYTDLTGHRFGKLVVLRREVQKMSDKVPKPRIVWWCKCDCGSEVGIRTTHLASGATLSCGCFQRARIQAQNSSRSLPKGVAAWNALLGTYRASARKRHLAFTLGVLEFKELVSGLCYYCGAPPANVIPSKHGRNGGIVYTGIDRVDNDKGYELGNVVSCCITCNRGKGTMSVDQFKSWITRTAQHMNQGFPSNE